MNRVCICCSSVTIQTSTAAPALHRSQTKMRRRTSSSSTVMEHHWMLMKQMTPRQHWIRSYHLEMDLAVSHRKPRNAFDPSNEDRVKCWRLETALRRPWNWQANQKETFQKTTWWKVHQLEMVSNTRCCKQRR